MAMTGGNVLTSQSLNENIPLRNQLQMEVSQLYQPLTLPAGRSGLSKQLFFDGR